MARDCAPDDPIPAFRDAMSRAVTGVSVVTTDGVAGRFGLTVSSVTSVSADPPLVLVCINARTPIRDAITANGVFTISLLSTEQRAVADMFAGRSGSGRHYEFDAATWTPGTTGAPRLDGAVAAFDCRLHHHFDAGTHRVFVGAVTAVVTHDAEPLAYSRRRYGRTASLSA